MFYTRAGDRRRVDVGMLVRLLRLFDLIDLFVVVGLEVEGEGEFVGGAHYGLDG